MTIKASLTLPSFLSPPQTQCSYPKAYSKAHTMVLTYTGLLFLPRVDYGEMVSRLLFL